MRTQFFNLSQDEIDQLDKERFNEEVEEQLQQNMWQQNHIEFIESKMLGGEVELEIQ